MRIFPLIFRSLRGLFYSQSPTLPLQNTSDSGPIKYPKEIDKRRVFVALFLIGLLLFPVFYKSSGADSFLAFQQSIDTSSHAIVSPKLDNSRLSSPEVSPNEEVLNDEESSDTKNIDMAALNLDLGYDPKHNPQEELEFGGNNKWLRNRRFGVVIDAGSSGSRVYVYSWKDGLAAKELAKLPGSHNSSEYLVIEKGVEGDEPWQKKVVPGISSFVSSTENIPSHLAPLLDFALKIVPEQLRSITPIYLLATAGLRLIEADQRHEILNQACEFVREKYPFVIAGGCERHFRVISGELEGIYGWLAVNYLMGGFDLRNRTASKTNESPDLQDHHTFGFLDMGGASTQIAFEPTPKMAKEHADDLTSVRLRNIYGEDVVYKVYVTTFLGFGMNQARKRYLEELVKELMMDRTLLEKRLKNIRKVIRRGDSPVEIEGEVFAERPGENFVPGNDDTVRDEPDPSPEAKSSKPATSSSTPTPQSDSDMTNTGKLAPLNADILEGNVEPNVQTPLKKDMTRKPEETSEPVAGKSVPLKKESTFKSDESESNSGKVVPLKAIPSSVKAESNEGKSVPLKKESNVKADETLENGGKSVPLKTSDHQLESTSTQSPIAASPTTTAENVIKPSPLSKPNLPKKVKPSPVVRTSPLPAGTLELADPCLPVGLNMTENSLSITPPPYIYGTGDFEKCRAVQHRLLNITTCSDNPCIFNGVHAPISPSELRFLGVSEYWYTSNEVFGLGGLYNHAKYAKATKEYCQTEWWEIKRGLSEGKWFKVKEHDEERLKLQCFKSSWIMMVLHDGFGIPTGEKAKMVGSGGGLSVDENDQYEEDALKFEPGQDESGVETSHDSAALFQSVDTIGDFSVSWTLGAILLHAAAEISPKSSNRGTAVKIPTKSSPLPNMNQPANHLEKVLNQDYGHDQGQVGTGYFESRKKTPMLSYVGAGFMIFIVVVIVIGGMRSAKGTTSSSQGLTATWHGLVGKVRSMITGEPNYVGVPTSSTGMGMGMVGRSTIIESKNLQMRSNLSTVKITTTKETHKSKAAVDDEELGGWDDEDDWG
ncbi:Golgi apyrase [Nowakowskiella sp. JEL0407]|nr:Golgi apyrase [Nowakowskiella sp. JEL0407]